MPRTDRRGRSLKTFLVAEILGTTDITSDELREAVGATKNRWYGPRKRADEEDFPDPNELRNLSEHYQMGDDGWLNLLVEFGWMRPREDAIGFTRPISATRKGVGTTTVAVRPKPAVDWHHRGTPL